MSLLLPPRVRRFLVVVLSRGCRLVTASLALTVTEMDAISALDRPQRYNDPAVFCEKAFNTFYPIFD